MTEKLKQIIYNADKALDHDEPEAAIRQLISALYLFIEKEDSVEKANEKKPGRR